MHTTFPFIVSLTLLSTTSATDTRPLSPSLLPAVADLPPITELSHHRRDLPFLIARGIGSSISSSSSAGSAAGRAGSGSSGSGTSGARTGAANDAVAGEISIADGVSGNGGEDEDEDDCVVRLATGTNPSCDGSNAASTPVRIGAAEPTSTGSSLAVPTSTDDAAGTAGFNTTLGPAPTLSTSTTSSTTSTPTPTTTTTSNAAVGRMDGGSASLFAALIGVAVGVIAL